MNALIIFLSFTISSICYSQEISTSILKRVNKVGSCKFENCYNLNSVVDRAGKFSFESQEGLLELFSAGQMIKVRTGQLLPSFNLRITNPIDIFEYIPNLIGFIFPSNWYRLKESKLHAKAQEHSYVSLVANQKSMGRDMFLASHQEASSLSILENHVDFSSQVTALMRQKYELGETSGEDLEEMSAFSEMLKTEEIIQSNLVSISSSELSYLINNIEAGEYPGPTQISLPDLTLENRINPKELITSVLEISPELKSFTYLIEAAKFSKKARSFEFLTPGSGTDNAFGFGYFASKRIGQRETESLRIDKKSFESNLKKAVSIVAIKYNSSLDIYQHAISIEKSLIYVLESLLSDFQVSSKIDINRVAAIIRESLAVQQMKNNSVHGFLVAKGQLERLMFETDVYSSIYATLPTNTKKLDCYLRKENKQIKIAQENGELQLPEELSFDEEDTQFCI